MGWLAYETIFSQNLAGRGNGTVFSHSGLFFIAPLTALQAADPRAATTQWEKQHKLLLSTSVFLLLQICTNRALFCFQVFKSSAHPKNERNNSEHGECSCWWEPITGLWFLPLCEVEAVLLVSGGLTALPVFCSSEHLPDKCCWKESAPWKPPETPSFKFQVFKEPRDPQQKKPIIFLITCHLQHSPQLLLHVHWPAARTEMSCDSTGFSWGSGTDFIGQN